MEAIQALKERRSVRKFTSEKITRAELEEIVDCGRLAATARNEQPWEFIVIDDPARLQAVAAITDYGKFIAEAAACIAVFCRDGKYYLEDGSAATQNLLVAAWALGLGACWVAGDKKPYAAEIAKLLGVPEGYKLVSLVALGHPAQVGKPPKRPLAEVLHWNQW